MYQRSAGVDVKDASWLLLEHPVEAPTAADHVVSARRDGLAGPPNEQYLPPQLPHPPPASLPDNTSS